MEKQKEFKKYWLEKYDVWIDYDGTAEGLVSAIKNNDVVCEDRLRKAVRKMDDGGWMECYKEDTEGRRVKGGGGTEPTGKAKNAKSLMARKEIRWPDWREES